ncbi:MAG: polyprenyl synthetase family protein [Terrimicrobiaceae bacterium]
MAPAAVSFCGVNLKDYLKKQARAVDREMKRLLPKPGEKPATLHRAMHYSLFAGGKRMRPVLCLAAAEACGGEVAAAMPSACAIELVHTYSLIHDDLPCMDDDDLRRGKPTSHKKFGEGVAVLAGDALLTEAFAILAETPPTTRHPAAAFVKELAAAAGSRFLIAGQVADLEAEGKTISRQQLRFIHEGKTSAMISVALRLGAMSANAKPAEVQAMGEFGNSLGLAFQVIDDILDITQSSDKLGKSAGKDEKAGKSTYPAVIGLEASREEARTLTTKAKAALSKFGAKAARLHEIADHLLVRDF